MESEHSFYLIFFNSYSCKSNIIWIESYLYEVKAMLQWKGHLYSGG
jgi:hypothetical protein